MCVRADTFMHVRASLSASTSLRVQARVRVHVIVDACARFSASALVCLCLSVLVKGFVYWLAQIVVFLQGQDFSQHPCVELMYNFV